VVEIRKTAVFATWLDGLADLQARARIQARIERKRKSWRRRACGRVRVGTSDSLWSGLSRLFQQGGREIIILLAGGDKRTQAKDIKIAIRLAKNL
jgi:putative addiction module killer protein